MADDKKRELEESTTTETIVDETTNKEESTEDTHTKKKLKIDNEEAVDNKKEETTATETTDKKEETAAATTTTETTDKKEENKNPFAGTSIFGSKFSSGGFGSVTSSTTGSTPFSFNLNSTSTFTFGFNKSAAETSSNTSGLFGSNNNINTSSSPSTTEGGENTENKENNDSESSLNNGGFDEPKDNNFKPLIEAQQVDLGTGEEEETTLCSTKGKLYILQDKQYKERGIGLVRVNKDLENKSRIIMNVNGSKKSILNVNIFPKMKVDIPNEKSLQFVALEGDKICTFLLKMAKADEIQTFSNTINSQIKLLEEAASTATEEKKE